jgi:hypothetical protein
MRTIDLPDASPDFAELLEQAGHADLIIRLGDGREFLLVECKDDFAREVESTRNNQELMDLLEARARQVETVPLEEVKRRLGL